MRISTLTSAIIHAADHMSEGYDHPNSIVTSGPRYCRVLTIVDLCSLSYVAPPKSITANKTMNPNRLNEVRKYTYVLFSSSWGSGSWHLRDLVYNSLLFPSHFRQIERSLVLNLQYINTTSDSGKRTVLAQLNQQKRTCMNQFDGLQKI